MRPAPRQSHHCVSAVLIEAARPISGTRRSVTHRPLLRRILGSKGTVSVSDLGDDGSLDDAQVSIAKSAFEQNFGPCQERYQRLSIGFKPEGVISPSGANVPDRVGKRGIRQGRTSNFATAMWVDRLQHVNRRPNGNPPESGLSD